jgi:hypothetical protein
MVWHPPIPALCSWPFRGPPPPPALLKPAPLFRYAVPAHWSDNLVWCSGTHPLLSFAALCLWPSLPPLSGPPASAANVNPRMRLSYMTPFSGRDERYRLMMKIPGISRNSQLMIPRILRRARDFPRIFRESRTTRPGLEHTTPTPTQPPLKPGA